MSSKNMKFLWVITILCVQLVNAQTWYAFQGYEYFIDKTGNLFEHNEADKKCSTQHATLANVKTKELQDFLVDKIGKFDGAPFAFYIGATRNRTTNEFQWTDGTKVTETDTQWRTGEPNNVDEKCVTMGWNGEKGSYRWLDISCTTRTGYICQRKLAVTTTAIVTTDMDETSSLASQTAINKPALKSELTTVQQMQETANALTETSDARNPNNVTKESTTESGSESILVAVVASITGFLVVATAIAGLFFYYRHQRSKTKLKKQEHPQIKKSDLTHQERLTTKKTSTYENTVYENQEQETEVHVYGNTAEQPRADHSYDYVVNLNEASHTYINTRDTTDEVRTYNNTTNPNPTATYAKIEEVTMTNEYQN